MIKLVQKLQKLSNNASCQKRDVIIDILQNDQFTIISITSCWEKVNSIKAEFRLKQVLYGNK